MKMRIRDYVPVGMDLKKVGMKIVVVSMIPILYSLQFVQNFGYAIQIQAFETREAGSLQLMADFVEVLGSSFVLFPVGILGYGLLALLFYRYHVQGSKSIYVMKRLPNSWELWRRVWTIPILAAVGLAVIAGLLLVIYYGYYLLESPVGSVQPHQWQILIDTWF